jgi:integrase
MTIRLSADAYLSRPASAVAYHQHESVVQKAVAQAARSAGSPSASDRALRHCFATHRLRHPDRQELAGHRDVRTTMTFLHVMQRGALGMKSPLDQR